MNKILYLAIFTLFSFQIFSQLPVDAKRDNIWLLGYESPGHTKDSLYGNSIIQFDKKPVKAKFKYIDMYFNDDIAIISDTSGKLLFYTNGIYIADSTHKPMKNGQGLNPGKIADNFQDDGYVCSQGALILPKPGSNDLFYLIHNSIRLDTSNPMIAEYVGEKLYYTLIDMSKNNGKGAVMEKNKVIYDSTYIDYGKITACRHANGIDWWIIVADFDTKNLNVFLLSSKGIENKGKQIFPLGFKGGLGQAHFTPDGTKYVRLNGYDIYTENEIQVFDFDRCLGKLSNQRVWANEKDTTYSAGMAISSNSRYLYACLYERVYQFDLQAQDIFSTLDTVAVIDGFMPPEFKIKTKFYLAQLAPDNKIYISIPGTAKYLHVIHEPNKKGKACNVEQRGMVLPSFNYTTMPNFPNFRLGKAAQPCTVRVEDEVERENIKIYPNPTSNTLTLDIGNQKIDKIAIYSIDGKLIEILPINSSITAINVSYLQNGIYYCRLFEGENNTSRIKFTIIR